MASQRDTSLTENQNLGEDVSANTLAVACGNKTYDGDDEDRRAYVVKYNNNTPYPFEVGETVWVVKPDYRAPLGEFRIVKAHPDDFFELVRGSDNQPHTELIAGKDLRRGV